MTKEQTRIMIVDTGDITADFDLTKERFSHQVYEQLRKEIEPDKATRVMMHWKEQVSKLEGKKTIQEVVEQLKNKAKYLL